jgi:hypothetical protein
MKEEMAPQVGLESACKRQLKDLVATAGKVRPSRFMQSKELISGITFGPWNYTERHVNGEQLERRKRKFDL